ncbi:hypothetical protein HNP84_000321 [Thermocatellispora tengchongensis]|uniref:Uncharacterized protein n=1 Tax=Thermocatellispora tengchongensis TaxID=1073253 RepID=A0A840NY61_9ACTN|nr:MFS transporter [Thermocatellispora tengchongensis]MBB5130633.1 hypothetical protein [Thermocatellispora tengchongensis]
MLARPPLRLLRATAFAVVCAGLSALAHIAGGGSFSAPHLAGGVVLAFCAAVPLTGRERTLAAILPVLGGLQVVLHFMLGGAAAHVAHAAHHHAAGGIPGLGMTAAHAWAAALTALWLARGERALWSLLRRLAVRLRVLVAVHAWAPADLPQVPCRAPEPATLRALVLCRHSVTRRGPPFVRVNLSRPHPA